MSKPWYRGFDIYYWPEGSQHWKAEQHGVTMNARSYAALCVVIDQHLADRAAWIKERQA
jgi:hypothetical protein